MFLQGRGSDRGLGGVEKAVEAGETCLQVTDGFGTSHPRLLRKPWDFRKFLATVPTKHMHTSKNLLGFSKIKPRKLFSISQP